MTRYSAARRAENEYRTDHNLTAFEAFGKDDSEQIFYGEFDGRRAKRVLIKVIGE